jgi:hypothetical protein
MHMGRSNRSKAASISGAEEEEGTGGGGAYVVVRQSKNVTTG